MKNPNSFKIFLIVVALFMVSIFTAFCFSFFQVDKKYSMLLAIIMFIVASLSTVGIYTGFKYQIEEKKMKILNRIGLAGNLFIFLLVLSVMVYAALTQNG